ncbi:hypothetical protein Q75_07605 [Bacillus coahuilensis p1.1.43]|uniref:ECF transporter S component n=1 Tax=Bacillus coahuilensis p1.1.43 TaxID=1150625 RepID=A0A147K877_9BACI|nr:ECF transporter S component [Bacillus coahuilensis]KUP06400.1 hypothetical protein Q75_07605 [Bacillus coahuilensis p1.1.43]
MKTSRVNLIAAFIALSVIGGFIKIPSPISSIALDSVAPLIAASMFGGMIGGFIGSIGHLLSSLSGGFPLGPFHFIIMIEMFCILFIYALFYKTNKWVAFLFFIGANTFLAPLPFFFFMGPSFYFSLLPSLGIATVVNIILVIILLPKIQWIYSHRFSGTFQ